MTAGTIISLCSVKIAFAQMWIAVSAAPVQSTPGLWAKWCLRREPSLAESRSPHFGQVNPVRAEGLTWLMCTTLPLRMANGSKIPSSLD
jgi:hypothetical protein